MHLAEGEGAGGGVEDLHLEGDGERGDGDKRWDEIVGCYLSWRMVTWCVGIGASRASRVRDSVPVPGSRIEDLELIRQNQKR